MIFLRLFFEFFKTGLFSVGGGLATLPFLYEMQAHTGWFSVQDVINMIAVSESTPGPLGINMATYVGYIAAGVPGSVVAVLGEITPAIFIIYLISKFLEKFSDSKAVQYAMYGLRAASAALIMAAGFLVAKVTFLNLALFKQSGNFLDLIKVPAILMGLIIFLVYKKTKKHPIYYILAAGIAGVIFSM